MADYDDIDAEDVRGLYTVGDEINLTVSVEHSIVNVTGIRVIFVHDDDEGIVITFTGDLSPVNESPEDENAQPAAVSYRSRRSEANVVFPVTLEHVPGFYGLSFVEVETASGRTIRHDDGSLRVRGDFRFVIGEEDSDINTIVLRFKDWQPTDVTHDDATTIE